MQLHFLLISALTRPFRGGARVELIRSSVVRPSVRPSVRSLIFALARRIHSTNARASAAEPKRSPRGGASGGGGPSGTPRSEHYRDSLLIDKYTFPFSTTIFQKIFLEISVCLCASCSVYEHDMFRCRVRRAVYVQPDRSLRREAVNFQANIIDAAFGGGKLVDMEQGKRKGRERRLPPSLIRNFASIKTLFGFNEALHIVAVIQACLPVRLPVLMRDD